MLLRSRESVGVGGTEFSGTTLGANFAGVDVDVDADVEVDAEDVVFSSAASGSVNETAPEVSSKHEQLNQVSYFAIIAIPTGLRVHPVAVAIGVFRFLPQFGNVVSLCHLTHSLQSSHSLHFTRCYA